MKKLFNQVINEGLTDLYGNCTDIDGNNISFLSNLISDYLDETYGIFIPKLEIFQSLESIFECSTYNCIHYGFFNTVKEVCEITNNIPLSHRMDKILYDIHQKNGSDVKNIHIIRSYATNNF